jgi:hypothetical protein
MKKKSLLMIFILIPGLLFPLAKEGDELHVLDDLIASSERQLTVHKNLRDLIAEFQKQQDLFHQGEQTKELAIQMVQTASKIFQMAEEHQLMHLFTPFFIEELKLFSGIAKKKHPTSLQH